MLVEWKEDNNTDALAIFLIDDEMEPGVCNWLVHRARSRSDGSWNILSTSWSIAGVGHLKALFEGARHMLGILELPTLDVIYLCCTNERKNYTEDAFTSKA